MAEKVKESNVSNDDLRDFWREIILQPSREAEECLDAMVLGSREADSLRSSIAFLKYARQTKRISQHVFQDLLFRYMDKYSEIVDNFQGLNNYSDEALELAKSKSYPNESKKWVSTVENITAKDIRNILPTNLEPVSFSEAEMRALLESFNCVDLAVTDKQVAPDNLAKNSFQPFPENNMPQEVSTKVPDSRLLDVPSNRNSCAVPKHTPTAQPESFQIHKIQEQKSNLNYNQNMGVSNRKPEVRKYIPAKTFEGSHKRKLPEDEPNEVPTSFKTAKEKLISDDIQKHGLKASAYGSYRKCLGSRRNVGSGFVPPVVNKPLECDKPKVEDQSTGIIDERLKNIDPKMVELMNNEIMDHGPPVTWQDIAGLEFAKKTIQEIVVWPMLRPDLFTGLRGPPKGILLFGPPGTGKTLIGKCIASQSKSTFFCISASSLTSKWVGEGEKLVRALFAVARCYQPAVIFIDEIDSLLTHRSDNEHESSRRIKTEFLVQLDGASTSIDERLLIVGATNRPQELDEAARRRLVKRLYIPLPDGDARKEIVEKLLVDQKHCLSGYDMETICQHTEGYSGADMANLCKEAALGPMRDLNFADIEHIMLDQVRPINFQDFIKALKQVRASVSDKDLQLYQDWNDKYGSASF